MSFLVVILLIIFGILLIKFFIIPAIKKYRLKVAPLPPSEVTLPKVIMDRGYTIGQRLGSGAFSTVYKATHRDKPGVVFACKRFDLTDESQEVWREKCLKSEMKIMMTLKHPNIIKAYDVFKTRRTAFIFMAFAENGNVAQYLERTKRPIQENLSKKWFGDIAKAVSYMHEKGIAHRDLKPDNFLLNNDFKDALISDFGFSCMALDNQNTILKGTNCGSDLYKSPELLSLTEGHVYDAKKSDVYAMGVSLFEMLNYNKPFTDEVDSNESNQITYYMNQQKLKKFRYNKSVKLSQNAIKCLEKLLEPEPKRRITIQALLSTKWLATK